MRSAGERASTRAGSSAPKIRIGTAGWSIPAAQAVRFPADGSVLQRYARVFNAVEINSSFYRPHRPTTYARWAAATPEDFRFSVKMPKAISHLKRLRDCVDDVQEFLDQASALGEKLGCLLLQLPPSLRFDPAVALAFFDRLRAETPAPIVCEPRHASWFSASVNLALRVRDIGRVAADPPRLPQAIVPAGDRRLEYLRLHGSPRVYYDAYSQETLNRIARRARRPSVGMRERWIIFDNTAEGYACDNALQLRDQLGAGLCGSARER